MAATEERSTTGTDARVRPAGLRAARALLVLAAVAAGAAAVFTVVGLGAASSETVVVETWRAYGLAVLAGLFVLLLVAHLRCRGWRSWRRPLVDGATRPSA